VADLFAQLLSNKVCIYVVSVSLGIVWQLFYLYVQSIKKSKELPSLLNNRYQFYPNGFLSQKANA